MFDMKRREFTRLSALRRWPICGARNPLAGRIDLAHRAAKSSYLTRPRGTYATRVLQADLCDRETCHADAT
jgi:hypothetical protein